METKANYTLIGAFTLGIIAAAFAFVFWFSGSKSTERATYEVIFTGSVSGLSRGSQVLFNGLRVGEVTQIEIMENDPSRVDALISVSTRAKITTDTRARLEFQGLTGVAAIALTGGSATAEELKPPPKRPYPIVYADRSDLQNLLEAVQRLSTKADSIMTKADTLLGENAASISQSVRNAETFTKALAENSDGVNTFLSSMADVGRTLKPLSVKLEALSGDIDALVKAVEPDKVRGAIGNIESLTSTLAKNEGNINSMLADAAAAAKKVGDTSATLDGVLQSAGEVIKNINGASLNAAIDGVARVTQSGAKVIEAVDPEKLRTLVANGETFAAALAKSAPSIDGFVGEATNAAKQINSAGGKLDGLLASAGDTVKAIDPAKLRGLIDDLGKLAASGAQVAAAVDADKVRSFVDSASGLADVLRRNQPNVDSLLANAAGAAKQLNASSDKLDGLLASAGDVVRAVDPTKLRSALDDLGKLTSSGAQVAAAVDPDKVRGLVDGASDFAGVLRRNQPNVDSILADAAVTAKNLGASSGKLDGVLGGASDLFKGLDTAKINKAVDNVSRFAASLGDNRDNIDSTLRNASELTGKLNASADRIDAVLKGLDGFLGGGKTPGMFTDIADAARSIKKLADNLDLRTRDIAAGINRFTGPGLREYEALAADGRRTLNDLNRAVRSIERNPSQVIFGGKPTLPEYKGQ